MCLNLNFAAGSNMEKESITNFLQSKLLESLNLIQKHAHWGPCRSVLVIDLIEETRAISVTVGCF